MQEMNVTSSPTSFRKGSIDNRSSLLYSQGERRDSTDSGFGYAYTSYRDSLNSRVQKKKMTSTVRASNKAAILAVGEELRLLLHEEDPPLIKVRRYHLKTYDKCFVGHEMVDWLIKKGEVESRSEAVAMMQKLLDHGVVHHGKLASYLCQLFLVPIAGKQWCQSRESMVPELHWGSGA